MCNHSCSDLPHLNQPTCATRKKFENVRVSWAINAKVTCSGCDVWVNDSLKKVENMGRQILYPNHKGKELKLLTGDSEKFV